MKIIAPLFVFFCWLATAQPNPPSGQTTGACSPINTGNSNTFNITCGIGKQQGDALLKIINKILANQTDLIGFGGKLDEILKAVNTIATGRTLDSTQQRAIAAILSATPREVVPITAYLSAEDGTSYGKALGDAILMGGWGVQGNAVNQAAATQFDSIRGVAILVPNKENPPTAAVLLQRALKAAQVDAPFMTSNEGLVLWIGRR
jgi:hypothetical protein